MEKLKGPRQRQWNVKYWQFFWGSPLNYGDGDDWVWWMFSFPLEIEFDDPDHCSSILETPSLELCIERLVLWWRLLGGTMYNVHNDQLGICENHCAVPLCVYAAQFRHYQHSNSGEAKQNLRPRGFHILCLFWFVSHLNEDTLPKLIVFYQTRYLVKSFGLSWPIISHARQIICVVQLS